MKLHKLFVVGAAFLLVLSHHVYSQNIYSITH
jgi:hypothetical protein